LGSAVNNEIKGNGTEERIEAGSIADVQIVVSEVLRDFEEAVAVPGGVSLFTEKDGAHVVVDAVDPVPLAIKMLDGLRTDQAAGAGYENGVEFHTQEWARSLYLFCKYHYQSILLGRP
jgi:hypothetical protein